MRLTYAAPIALVVAASGIALAQAPMQMPGAKNPAAVTGGTYTADPNHTMVLWTLNHLGFTPYTGIFGSVTGTLTLDAKNPNGAKVDVTIPLAKVTTANAGLTAHLLRAPKEAGGKPDFFGPTPADARFVSTKVVATGQTAKVTGDFTFNGVTKPVTLDVQFYGAGKMPAAMGGKDNVGFHATGTIVRSQFGFGYGAPMIGDEVKLDIAAAFEK